MFKTAGRFANKLNVGGRRGRFSPGLSSSSTQGRQDRRVDEPTHWRALAARLDAEVARVTPSRKPKSRAAEPKPSKPRVVSVGGKRVYLVSLKLRSDPSEQFLKVGISGADIRSRFSLDAKTYEITLVAESQRFEARDAWLTEQAIHAALIGKRYRPKVPLNSGNTECYVYDEPALHRFLAIVNAV